MHFIAEQILRYISQLYCMDSTKIGTKRVFSFQQKLSYLFLQDIRAPQLKLVKVLLYLYACNFYGLTYLRVFKKTKICVPFEVQYCSSVCIYMHVYVYIRVTLQCKYICLFVYCMYVCLCAYLCVSADEGIVVVI